VRDESAIGQILACPKCGSMVMVEGPTIELDDFEDSELALAQGGTPSGVQPPDWDRSATTPGTGWLALSLGVVGVILVGSVAGFAWMRWPKDRVTHIAGRSMQTQLATEQRSPALDLPIVEEDIDVNKAIQDQPEIEADQPEAVAQEPSVMGHPYPIPTSEITVEERRFETDTILPPEFEEREVPTANPNSLLNIAQLLTSSQLVAEEETPRTTTAELSVATLATKSVHTSSSPSSPPRDAKKSIIERAAVRVPAVRFEKVPLVDFVRSVMQLSGVPIQVDPDALRQSGNVVEVPISVASIDTSAIELLRAALEPVKMMPVIEDRGIRITSSRLESRRVGHLSLFVGDLQRGEGKDLDLAILITTLIEPNSWESVGGVGSVEVKGDRLIVNHTHSVRIKTLVLLEKLRVTRGLRPRKKLPKQYTTLESRWTQVKRYLRRPINMDVWQEQPILEVVQELEEATGLRVIVDWLALEKMGVTTRSTAVLYARETPAATVFRHLIKFFEGSALVPISGDAVQITTQEAVRARPYLEVYSLKQLGEAGREKVEQLMLSGAAALDSASDVAIVVGDADVHRILAN